MKRLRLADLGGNFERHVLERQIGGDWLVGGLSPKRPGARTHGVGCTCQSCDGAGHHRHPDACEVFVFLAGRAVVEVDGAEHAVGAGDVIVIEPGEDHHVRAVTDCLNLYLHAAAAPE